MAQQGQGQGQGTRDYFLWMMNKMVGQVIQRQAAAAAQQNVPAPFQNGPQTTVPASGATASQGVQAVQAKQTASVQQPPSASGPAPPLSVPALTALLSTSTIQQPAIVAPAPIHIGLQAPATGPGPTTTQGVQAAQTTTSAIVQPTAAASASAHNPSVPAQPTATTQQAAPIAPAHQAIAQTQANQLAAAHRPTPWAYQPAPPFPPGLHVLTPPEVLARYPTGIPLQNGTPQLGPNEVLPPNVQVLAPGPRNRPVSILQNMASYIGTAQIPQHMIAYVQLLRTRSQGLSDTERSRQRQQFDRNAPPVQRIVFNNKDGVLQAHNTGRPLGRLYAELFDYWMDYRLFDHDEWWELITRRNQGRVWPHNPWQVDVL